MQQDSLDRSGVLMFVVVCAGFIIGGAAMIFLEQRQNWANDRLDVAAVETVGTLTRTDIEYQDSGDSAAGATPYHVIEYTYEPATGDALTGSTSARVGDPFWLQTPASEGRLAIAEAAVGDVIVVQYLPGRPSVHRPIEECPRCIPTDGAFARNLFSVLGIGLILLGGLLMRRVIQIARAA